MIEEGKEDFYDLIQNVTMNLTKTIDQAKKNASDLFDYIKEEGNYVVYDLYDVIREEAMNRTSEHVDALTELMTSFTDRVMDIHEDVFDVLSQDGALTDEEIKKRNDEEGLEELRELFDDIEEELKEEAAENDHLPEGVEKVIQTFLTTIRRMMASTSDKEAEFWSKLKQMEVKFWEIKAVLADTTIQLKEEIPSIIQTLQEADMELADYLEESIEFEDVPRAAFS